MLLRCLCCFLWILLDVPLAVGEESTIRKLLSMQPDQVATLPAFRLRATVTALGEGIATPVRQFGSIVVEDETGAMWVNVKRAESRQILETEREVIDQLEIGMLIDLQGIVADGAFAPVILPATITVLGSDNPRPMNPVDLERFLRGEDYLRTVTARGVVRSVVKEEPYGWLLQVETGLGYFLCRVPQRKPFLPQNLVDAEVRITGVAAVSRNWRREFVCPRLIIAKDIDFEILKPPLTDPFLTDLVKLDQLNAYSIEGTSLHRVRVEGVVTYADNVGRIFIQEGDFAVRIETLDAPALMPGDFVEVAGFIDSSKHVAGLSGAVVRVRSKREIPAPLPIRFSQILEEYNELLRGKRTQVPGYDGILAELSGEVLSHHIDVGRTTSTIEIDCGDAVATVAVMGSTRMILPGSWIKAIGAAQFEYNPTQETAYYTPPSKMELLVSGNTMIEVVSGPPWWNVQRALAAMVIAASLGFAMVIWAFSLRRALRIKAQQLAIEMNHRHDAALEFQAALRERTRLAANLHDTLLQTMSGIGYQLEACSRQRPRDDRFSSNLETAKRMVQRGQADLRGAVWALRAMPQQNGPFAESVHRIVEQTLAGHQCKVKVEIDPTIDHLADFVAGNLLLVIQESISNALRHANPQSITIEAKKLTHSKQIQVSVTDDGEGFSLGKQPSVVDGHFGIQGMQERIEKLSGHLQIDSQPSKGSTVTAVVPVREFDDLLEEQ